jgi:UDP-2,3-diacylglucosamine pyrophosphatase LpxH
MGADAYKEFARQQQLRFERMMREWRAEWTAELRELREWREAREAESVRRHEEVMRKLDEESAKTAEIIAEGRAQRGALLAIIDRLNGGGAEPAT